MFSQKKLATFLINLATFLIFCQKNEQNFKNIAWVQT